MGSLKEDWKETGKDLGGAFKQLGKSIVKSGATVVNKANDTVICSKCGAEITDPEAVFCLKCGEKLEK